jgi:hypothetical protein
MNIGHIKRHIKNNTTSLDGVMGPALGAIAAFAVCSTGGGVALLSFFPMLGFVCMMKGLWLLYGWRMSKSSNGFVNALVF